MAILPGLLRELLVLGDGPTEVPGNLGRALLLLHLGLEDLLVWRGRINEVVDDALLLLAPPVNAPYDLLVDLRVPGDFKDDLDVSRLEVEPGSTTALVDEDDVIVREVLSDVYRKRKRISTPTTRKRISTPTSGKRISTPRPVVKELENREHKVLTFPLLI